MKGYVQGKGMKLNRDKKIILLGLPITFLGVFGIAYIQALGSIEDSKPIEYREDCDTVNFSVYNNGMFSVLCDLREQNEKLIDQNDRIILELQKQTALLDHIDCSENSMKGYYGYKTTKEICGDPLNVTGVWNP